MAKRKRNAVGKAALVLVLGCLPSLYSASTRLPFIFIAVEVMVARSGSLWQVSILLGCYQTCRASANAIIGSYKTRDPFRVFFLPQMVLAAVGYLLSAIIPHNDSVWPMLLFMLVGLSETVVTIQVAALKETRNDSPTGSTKASTSTARLRWQYLCISGGAAVAFIFGGRMYASLGFTAICWFGFILNLVCLACGAAYYVIGARDIDPAIGVHGTDGKRSASRRPSAYREPAAVAKGARWGGDGGDPYSSQHVLRSLSYKFAAAAALADASRGRSPADDKVRSVAPIAHRDEFLMHNLQELYHDLDTRHGNFGEKAITDLLSVQEHDKASDGGQGLAAQAHIVCCLLAGELADDNHHIDMHTFIAWLVPRCYLKQHPDAASQPTTVYPYLRVVIVTQAVMALCIGTFLSTSLLYYEKMYGYGPQETGLLLGLGEALAVLFMLIATCFGSMREKAERAARKLELTKNLDQLLNPVNKAASGLLLDPMNMVAENGARAMTKSLSMIGIEMGTIGGYTSAVPNALLSVSSLGANSARSMQGVLGTMAGRPLHVPIIVTFVGLFTTGFTLPSLGLAIVCQLIFSGINDLSVSLLNELTATSIPPSQFQANQALGQWLRRLGNCLTAFTGPLLFGWHPRVPFLFYGGVVAAWGALILWPSIYVHARTIAPAFPAGSFPPITAFRCFTNRNPWHEFEKQYAYVAAQESNRELNSVLFDMARLGGTVRRLNGEVERLSEEVRALKAA